MSQTRLVLTLMFCREKANIAGNLWHQHSQNKGRGTNVKNSVRALYITHLHVAIKMNKGICPLPSLPVPIPCLTFLITHTV